jgi:transforming growth factor-beta-induced protein
MQRKHLIRTLAVVASLSIVATACGDDGDDSSDTTTAPTADQSEPEPTETEATDAEPAEPATVVDIATSNEDFSILVEAVTAAGLGEALTGDGPFTVFAPTNEAFAGALEALGVTKEELLANENLAAILQYHVVSGKVLSTDLQPEQSVATLQGEEVQVVLGDAGATINGANIVITDLEAGNGVVHVIDQVILPPTIAEALGL